MSEQFCPKCDNHCPVSALNCGKGRRYFGMDSEERGEHGGERGGLPHRKPETGCIGMLRQCGHILHHGQPEGVDLLSSLSDGERAELERLLGKLMADWQSTIPMEHGHHRRH